MNNLITIILAMFFISNIEAQQKTDEDTLCVKNLVVEYFISINRLDNKSNIEELYDNIGIAEIVDHKVLGYSEKGIYLITNFHSHEPNYILLKKYNNYKIITFKDTLSSLQEILSFLKEMKIGEEKSLEYLNKILKLLDYNQKSIVNEQLVSDSDWISCD